MIGLAYGRVVEATPLDIKPLDLKFLIQDGAVKVALPSGEALTFGVRYVVVKRDGLELRVDPYTGAFEIHAAKSKRYGTAVVRAILDESYHLDLVLTNPAADEVYEPGPMLA